MILIKFVRKSIDHTWFVNENWIAIFIFSIILLGGITIIILKLNKLEITNNTSYIKV